VELLAGPWLPSLGKDFHRFEYLLSIKAIEVNILAGWLVKGDAYG